MTLKTKLLASLGVLALTLIIVAGAFTYSARTSQAALDTVLNDRVLPLRDLKTAADGYAVLIVDSTHKARSGALSFAQAIDNIERGNREIQESWKAYKASQVDGEEARLATVAEGTMSTADGKISKLLAILRSSDQAALDQFVVHELYPAIDPVSDSVGKLVSMQIDIARDRTNEGLATAQTMLIVLGVLCVLGIIVLGVAFFTVTRKVVQPIQNLASVIHGMAKESGDAQLPHLDQRDEIGDIARAVEAFLASVVEKERETAAKEAATQTLVTSTLADGLQGLAHGDLTREIRVDFPSSYASLKNNFNEALAALRSLISAVSDGAATIESGSTEIAHASEDLARRTESNAASLEETSAALSQMDERLRNSVQSAEQTVRSANEAIRVVGDGRALADGAMHAMGRVRETAKGIDEVIEGVDKIAFQTRVLAMNAAVEAGRAGEAGRGFAVVADLVSALALRAEEEAKRARDQLTLTQSEVGVAVDAVQRVDAALENISGGVNEVHRLLDAMAADNHAQSTAITQIASAVNTMDHSTQQNAAMVEETSAAARNLSTEVGALVEQSARFNTGAEATAKPVRRRSAAPTQTVAAAAMTANSWEPAAVH